jgi:hypothetical protein
LKEFFTLTPPFPPPKLAYPDTFPLLLPSPNIDDFDIFNFDDFSTTLDLFTAPSSSQPKNPFLLVLHDLKTFRKSDDDDHPDTAS